MRFTVDIRMDTTAIEAGLAASNRRTLEQTVQEIAVTLLQQVATEFPNAEVAAALQDVESRRQALMESIASKVSVEKEPE